MPKSSDLEKLQQEAWVGDAVLALYARSLILREDEVLDAAKCGRMTCNQFLSAWGEPTAVEARIGRVYEAEGLEGAFRWIESELLPLFRKQETKRMAALRTQSPRKRKLVAAR